MNLAIATLALPARPGNPRYLLFLMAPLPIFLAEALGDGWRRFVFVGPRRLGALASLAHVPGTLESDARWREFVTGLEREGVRHCYTDFHLATAHQLPLRREGRLHGQARAHDHRVLLRLPRSGRARAGGRPDSRQHLRRQRLGQRLTELGVDLRAPRLPEAGAAAPVPQGRPGGALPRTGRSRCANVRADGAMGDSVRTESFESGVTS